MLIVTSMPDAWRVSATRICSAGTSPRSSRIEGCRPSTIRRTSRMASAVWSMSSSTLGSAGSRRFSESSRRRMLRQRRANAVVEVEANPPALLEVGVLQGLLRVAEIFADSDRFGGHGEVVAELLERAPVGLGDALTGPPGDDDGANVSSLVVEGHRPRRPVGVDRRPPARCRSTVISTDPSRSSSRTVAASRSTTESASPSTLAPVAEASRHGRRVGRSSEPPTGRGRRPRDDGGGGHDHAPAADDARDGEAGRVVEQPGQHDEHGEVHRREQHADEDDEHRAADDHSEVVEPVAHDGNGNRRGEMPGERRRRALRARRRVVPTRRARAPR